MQEKVNLFYNHEHKKKFLEGEAKSSRGFLTSVFQTFKPYEEAWGDDLCTRSSEEVGEIFNDCVGIRKSSVKAAKGWLKRYIKWCVDIGYPNVNPDAGDVTVDNHELVRNRLVLNPFQMNEYIKVVFPEYDIGPGTEEVFKGYLWLGFIGVPEAYILDVKNDNVDFENMVVRLKDKEYEFDRYPLKIFRNLVQCDALVDRHPLRYNRFVKRIDGDEILRGSAESSLSRKFLTRRTSHYVNKAIELGKTEVALSYKRAFWSGIFYRMYEKERLGLECDFISVTDEILVSEGKDLKEMGRKARGKFARTYKKDYENWKKAFNLN